MMPKDLHYQQLVVQNKRAPRYILIQVPVYVLSLYWVLESTKSPMGMRRENS